MNAPTFRKPRTVAIDLRAREAYPWMLGVVLAIPGLVLVDEASGVCVRVREDGGLDEIGGIPARRSIASDPFPGSRP